VTLHIPGGGEQEMDPFVATILKESALVLAGFAAVGVFAALIYGLFRYSQLQDALTLNVTPPSLP
jgi:hypothetical protein